jgi:hypothetical protein
VVRNVDEANPWARTARSSAIQAASASAGHSTAFWSIGTKRRMTRCSTDHAYTHTQKPQLRSLRPSDVIGTVGTTSEIREHAAAGLRLPLRCFDERHRCRDDAPAGALDGQDRDRDPGCLKSLQIWVDQHAPRLLKRSSGSKALLASPKYRLFLARRCLDSVEMRCTIQTSVALCSFVAFAVKKACVICWGRHSTRRT